MLFRSRAAILLSLATAALLICSTIVVGYSVYVFAKENGDAFSVTDKDLLKDENERWYWEVDLLFDTCDSRLGDWNWPEVLADQDDDFLYPGELRCDWQHQGAGDRASVVIYNRGDQTLDLVLEIAGGEVVFADEGDSDLTLDPIEPNGTAIVEIELESDVTEHDFTVEATTTHIASPDVHVNEAERKIVMYFHGLEAFAKQATRAAVSENGIDFTAKPEILGRTYMRAFRHEGYTYVMAMPGQFYRSRDPLGGFEEGPLLFNPNMRHAALLPRGEKIGRAHV